MNILLLGGTCSLMNSLIQKMKKEGHRVFLLTGNKYSQGKYERVFEKYKFDYDSEDLMEIFESVKPDVTICLGAFDTNYRWKGEDRETVRFTSDLINILVSFASSRHGKFIFLSSDDVYHGDYEKDIQEDEPTTGSDRRAAILIQAEEICKNFYRNWDIDLMILRLDHVSGIPKELKDVNNICAKMCLESMRKGYIEADLYHSFSVLYEKDAVEFIYQTVKKKVHGQMIYHLSSDRVVSEVELAGMIREGLGNSCSIVTVTGSGGKCVLSGKNFEEEYGIHSFCELEVFIKKLTKYMKRHEDIFLKENERKLPWWKRFLNKWTWLFKVLFPFVENIICFIPFFMMNNRTVGSEYFANLDPYLLYVLLFAIIYGQQQATFSAICAVAGYLFRQMYTRSGFEVVLDYNTYVWVAQLFILGLVVGYMRDQIKMIRMESKELEEHLSRQIVDIKDINGSNVRVKGVLEQQLIDHRDSIGKIYSITSTLDQQLPDEVLFDAVEMMTRLLHTKDVAIYNVVSEDYARMFSASSEKARSLGNSIRYRDMTEIYDELKEQKVYINKSMDDKYPLMVNAIYESGKIQMLIMLWGLGWERMTLGQANFLVVVSYLIQNAVLNARRYMNALEEQRYMEDSRIMECSAFTSLVQAYKRAKERNLAECTLLTLLVPQEQYREAGESLSRQLRASDYLGILEDRNLYILLANTTQEDAEFVQEKLKNTGYESRIVESVKL